MAALSERGTLIDFHSEYIDESGKSGTMIVLYDGTGARYAGTSCLFRFPMVTLGGLQQSKEAITTGDVAR
ncbi:hypothetical protein DB345_00145 [Spartobacteria bacterium LR76]|nr:hypothetical protein DB345_00145 [Spartobacteria bacterium LR76]